MKPKNEEWDLLSVILWISVNLTRTEPTAPENKCVARCESVVGLPHGEKITMK